MQGSGYSKMSSMRKTTPNCSQLPVLLNSKHLHYRVHNSIYTPIRCNNCIKYLDWFENFSPQLPNLGPGELCILSTFPIALSLLPLLPFLGQLTLRVRAEKNRTEVLQVLRCLSQSQLPEGGSSLTFYFCIRPSVNSLLSVKCNFGVRVTE